MGTVTINLAGMTGNPGVGFAVTGSGEKGKGEGGQVKNGSVFAGNINNMSNDRIERKREMARRQASKALMDQFGTDCVSTDKMDELSIRNEEINREVSALTDQRKMFAKEQEALKETYGIGENSEEQKQLELIRKGNKAFKSGDWSSLSKEELEQIAGMDTSQLTEYQKRALEYDDLLGQFDREIAALEDEKRMNGYTTRSLKSGLLKTSYKGIMQAYRTADAINEAASKEIIGMAWEDAKKHVEEEFQEMVEAAKEKAEEKKEEEEKLEEAKAEKEEQKELTEDIQDASADQEKLQGELKKIMEGAELLEEDMKGIVVDNLL